jgi:hypothetical protein
MRRHHLRLDLLLDRNESGSRPGDVCYQQARELLGFLQLVLRLYRRGEGGSCGQEGGPLRRHHLRLDLQLDRLLQEIADPVADPS